MKINGTEFGVIFAASGTRNFFGDGWWYHFWYKLLVPGFKWLYKCTFIAKTTTIDPRAGNMQLKENLQPKSLMPDCIKVYPLKGVVFNSVGLSGPGAQYLFQSNIWQKMEQPIVISFMAVGKTMSIRMEETRRFAAMFFQYSESFRSSVLIQFNKSCPNTGHDTTELEPETIQELEIFKLFKIPVDLKVNVLFSTDLLKIISDQKLCEVITVSNTIPYGTCEKYINWKKLFGRSDSPLKYEGGGLSGKVIFPIVIDKIKEMRAADITLPIKGGGGIMCKNDVQKMYDAGVNAFEIATVAMIRPWRVRGIVKKAEKLFK
jgi:dihydroorotate dehydrogenase